MKFKLLIPLCLLILSACDNAVDVRDRLPDVFPIKERVYSKVHFTKACVVAVYALEEEFKDTFQFQMLEKINTEKLSKYRNGIDRSYEPWQRTPILKKLHEMSKAVVTLSVLHNCLDAESNHMKILEKYNKSSSGFFTTNSGEVLIYAPEENLLFYTDWG